MKPSGAKGRSLLVAAATLIGVATSARLGMWQLDRAAQKIALQQALDQRAELPELPASALAVDEAAASAEHYRRVRLQGQWQADSTVYLDNRQMYGRPGFFVVTALRLDGGRAVMVQRGWVPRDAGERTRLPAVGTRAGRVEIVGHVAPPPSKLFDFAAAASATGPIRQNLDLASYAAQTRLPLLPLSVVQEVADSPGDGLSRDWPRPAVDVHKHYGYAFQWFALAALMAGLYVWFQLVRPRLRA
jgi:surfeit locus 1 family protein